MNKGTEIIIKGEAYFIGDVVKLTNIKNNVSMYFELIYSDYNFDLRLYNKSNSLASVHPTGKSWTTEAYIKLSEIVNGILPYMEIERIGSDKKSLKLLNKVKLKGMKPY